MRHSYFFLAACGVLATTIDSLADATKSKSPSVVGEEHTASVLIKKGNLVANVTIDVEQSTNEAEDPESSDSNDNDFTKQATGTEERALTPPGKHYALKSVLKHPIAF